MRKLFVATTLAVVLAVSACGNSDAKQWANDADLNTSDFLKAANEFNKECEPADLENVTSGCGDKLSTANDEAIDLAVAINDARGDGDAPQGVDNAGSAAVDFNSAFTEFAQGPRTDAVKNEAVETLDDLVDKVSELG